MASVGVKVEHGELLKEAVNKGTFKTVGDKEQAHIIELHASEGLSCVKIASELEQFSRTILTHTIKITTLRLSVAASVQRASAQAASTCTSQPTSQFNDMRAPFFLILLDIFFEKLKNLAPA